MRAYRCDMCRKVILLYDDPYDIEDPPGYLVYRPEALNEDNIKVFAKKYDLCHDCAQKIERFISDNIEEVRKKDLE